jgi:hypothetical protein
MFSSTYLVLFLSSHCQMAQRRRLQASPEGYPSKFFCVGNMTPAQCSSSADTTANQQIPMICLEKDQKKKKKKKGTQKYGETQSSSYFALHQKIPSKM